MRVRILDVQNNKMTQIEDVKTVIPHIKGFRVVYNDGNHKEYSFKDYDFFCEREVTSVSKCK